MDTAWLNELFNAHRSSRLPGWRDSADDWVDRLLGLLFPALSHAPVSRFEGYEKRWGQNQRRLGSLLEPHEETLELTPDQVVEQFYRGAPAILETLASDADAIFSGDPAAQSRTEVVHTYPGFRAIAIYRIAHRLHTLEVPLLPRSLTEYAHRTTGIDIHPGASIGERFCIDHGTGIVIGETTEIGRNVKLYQGVTLGALSVEKDLAKTKRHPTVEDDVVIYAGATVLGGETVVGEGSIIGGNVWLLDSVPPHSRVHYAPGTVVKQT